MNNEPPYHFIFDIGNVLINFDLAALQARISQETGTPEERIAPEWTGTETTDVESGRITPDEYYTAFARRMSLSWTYAEWVAAWSDIYTINENGHRILESLRGRGCPLHMLSNLAPYNVPAIKKAFPEFFADDIRTHFSFDLKFHKPAPGIFISTAAAIGIPPQQCVFIDDAQTNVTAARKTGMHAITFSDRNACEVAAYVNTFR